MRRLKRTVEWSIQAPFHSIEAFQDRDGRVYMALNETEETGLTAGRLQYLGANFTSPGYSEEVLHIYLARDLHRGAAHLDPGEFLNVERHPLEKLVQMALDGQLCDGKTTVALLKTQLLLARERGEAASGGL